MKPMTRSEIFMAAAAGEYDGDLPIPVTREDQYWQKVVRKIEDGNATPEEIDAAIEAYLNSHDADIVTEAELSDALAGKVDKETGKGLTDINYSADEQAKVTAAYEARHTHDNKAVLDGITEAKVRIWDAAQPNVNADWNAYSGDARILNKPDLSVYAREDDMTAALAGKSDAGHTHDDRYYTESETDIALAAKAAASHSHDDLYYTEAEMDAALGGKSNAGHTHDDRYYTETEIDALLDGKADGADIPDVSAFITRAVNDLVNYYTKSETYTQAEIDQMVSAIPKFAIQVVNALPTTDISPTTVYLLTSQTQENGNLYTEYLHVGNAWELLGSQTVDLSGYYTAAQIDSLISGLPVAGHTHDDRYYTESEIDAKVQTLNTAIGGKAESGHTHDDRYYTETETDTLLSGKANTGHTHDEATQSLAGLMSAADKTKLDGVATGANAYTHPAYTARTGSPSANQTPAFGGTVTVSQVTSDASGHVTGITDRTITIPDAAATQNTAGLMSAADKAALNALKPVILWSGASVANTITLNESVAGYDMVEVVGALDTSGLWSMSGKGIVNNGEVSSIGLCAVKGSWTGVGIDIDGCLINISGSTLTRGSALPSNIVGGDSREIHLNAIPSGSTLALTMNTGSNGAYSITILRVIGYKAVSA